MQVPGMTTHSNNIIIVNLININPAIIIVIVIVIAVIVISTWQMQVPGLTHCPLAPQPAGQIGLRHRLVGGFTCLS